MADRRACPQSVNQVYSLHAQWALKCEMHTGMQGLTKKLEGVSNSESFEVYTLGEHQTTAKQK